MSDDLERTDVANAHHQRMITEADTWFDVIDDGTTTDRVVIRMTKSVASISVSAAYVERYRQIARAYQEELEQLARRNR